MYELIVFLYTFLKNLLILSDKKRLRKVFFFIIYLTSVILDQQPISAWSTAATLQSPNSFQLMSLHRESTLRKPMMHSRPQPTCRFEPKPALLLWGDSATMLHHHIASRRFEGLKEGFGSHLIHTDIFSVPGKWKEETRHSLKVQLPVECDIRSCF